MNVASDEALPYLPVGKVHEDSSGRCRGPAAGQLKASLWWLCSMFPRDDSCHHQSLMLFQALLP